ncbi:MAG: aldehyde dehydrogenase [Candidatus Izemoplasmataceae bacterium]
MKDYLTLQRHYFKKDTTKPYQFRHQQLKKLYNAVQIYEDLIKEALKKDLNKSSFEAYTTEIGFTLHSIRKTMKQLKRWMKVQKEKTPYFHLFTKSFIQKEPLGQVLIIGPYNYPFQLVIEPLIGAIAAGNTAIIKPSEFAGHTEKVIKDLIEETFDPEYIRVVTGDKEVTSELIHLPFDHIFFTGSTEVGKIVYQAAAKNLVPVTLELGGKSPAIIDESANLKVAANRIVFGKYMNAGQTCIAPDYIYIDKKVKEPFIKALIKALDTLYPKPLDDYNKIINLKHFNRLKGLIKEDHVIYGNTLNEETLTISPTILDDITFNDAIMQEEIFGPLLPILTFDSLEQAIQTLKTKDKPLALYLFTETKAHEQKVFNRLSFGSGAINDTITQVASFYLPFGGVGASGIGKYHGKASFDTFSNEKTYVKKTTKFDPKTAYPPYKNKEKLIKKILK